MSRVYRAHRLPLSDVCLPTVYRSIVQPFNSRVRLRSDSPSGESFMVPSATITNW